MKPREAFVTQRRNAKRRGIEFVLTFEEWLTIWKRSGRLSMRGRGKNRYVMARIGDRGAYAKGNVCIILFGNNTREWWTGRKHSIATIAKLRAAHTPARRAKAASVLAERNKSRLTRRRNSELQRRRWADPEYRARICASLSTAQTKAWSSNGVRRQGTGQ